MKKIKILILALSVMMLAVSCSSGDDTKGEDQNKDTEQKNTDDKKNPGDLDEGNDNDKDDNDFSNLIIGTWKSAVREVGEGGSGSSDVNGNVDEWYWVQYGTGAFIFKSDKTGSEIFKGERIEYSDNYPEEERNVELIDEKHDFIYELSEASIKLIFQDGDPMTIKYEIVENKLIFSLGESEEKIELTRQ